MPLRVEAVDPGSDYAEFLAAFGAVHEAILAGIPIAERKACEAAFSERETGYVLYRWIREHKPTSVVETGTFLGLSALVCATALRKNFEETGVRGRVYSISLNSFYRVTEPLSRAAQTSTALGLHDFVAFLEGSSTPMAFMETSDPTIRAQREAYLQDLARHGRESLLHKLAAALGTVDLVFLDSLHNEGPVMTELAGIFGHLSPGGALFVDDVFLPASRGRAFSEFLTSLSRLSIDTYAWLDYARLGFHYFNLPWIADAFRATRIARASVIRSRGRILRVLKVQRNPDYSSAYGTFSTWHSSQSVEEMCKRFQITPVPAVKAVAGART